MNRNNSKNIILVGVLVAVFVLSGCGLNQRSASESDPVPVAPVEVIVTDPTEGGDTVSPDAVDESNTGEEAPVPVEGDGGSAESEQPADAGEAQDPAVEVEATVEEAVVVAEPAAVVEEPAAETPAEAPAVEAPIVDAATDGKHTVQAGETLFKIALRYGLTVEELAAANNITNVHVLSVDQELVIPEAGTVAVPQTASVHIVSYGDTIFNIAQRYGLTVEELALHNNIENVNRIDIGQEIKIPTSGG